MHERNVRAGAPRSPGLSLPMGEVVALRVSNLAEVGAPGEPSWPETSTLRAKLGAFGPLRTFLAVMVCVWPYQTPSGESTSESGKPPTTSGPLFQPGRLMVMPRYGLLELDVESWKKSSTCNVSVKDVLRSVPTKIESKCVS